MLTHDQLPASAICLNSNSYHGFGLADALEGANLAGIRYMEVSAVRDWTDHVNPDLNGDALADVRAMFHAAEVTPLALGGHSNLTTAEGRAAFQANLELAARLGARYVVTGTGETHGDESEIADEAAFCAELGPLLDHAASLGLGVGVETHGANYATGRQVAQLVRQLDRRNVGVVYDTGNVIFYAGVQPYDDLEDCADAVLAFHLKDKSGVQSEWNFPAVGDGDLDLPRLGSILTRTGCSAPLSIEIEFTPDGPADVNDVHRAVARSARAVRERLLPAVMKEGE